MTKELNLFVSETTNDTKLNKTTSGEDANVKNGKSLFDNLLSDINEEETTSKESSQSKVKTPSSQNKTEIKTPLTPTNLNVENKAEKENINKFLNKETVNNKTVNNEEKINKDIKTVIPKIENKTMSLLDRMMLEANEKITIDDGKIDTNIVKPIKNDNNIKTTPEVIVNEEDNAKDIIDGKKVEKSNKTNNSKNEIIEQNNNKPVEKSFFDSLLDDSNKPIDETIESKPVKAENKIETNRLKTLATLNPNLVDRSQVISQSSEEVTADFKNNTLKENLKGEVNNKQIVVPQNETTKQTITKTPEKAEVIPDTTKQTITKTPEKAEVIPDTTKQTITKTPEKAEVIPDTTKQTITKTPEKAEVIPDTTKQTITKTPEKAEVIPDTTKQTITKTPEKAEVLQELTSYSNKIETNIKDEAVITQKETEITKVVKSEVQTVKTVEKTIVKNENVANELAKISSTDIETKVNISKEEISKLDNKQDDNVKPDSIKPENIKSENTNNPKPSINEKSLLDRLVEESKILSQSSNKDELKSELNKSNELINKQPSEKNFNPLVTNMYLSAQQNSINKAAIVKVAVGKDMANNATNVKDIEKSAEFLDLGLEDTEVTIEKQEFAKDFKFNNLDKLAFAKTVVRQNLTKTSGEIASTQTSTTNVTNNIINEEETVVQLNATAQATVSIESRIIGARQQMGSMMSDVARNMYLNYKPPVTAFRINLTPGSLGSIAIVMKSDKENGLSISLNMSNNSTLDSFIDNQSSLRAALAKNFDSNMNLSLDFNMQNQNSSNENSNNQNSGNENTKNNNDDESIMANNNQGNKEEDVDSNYM